MTPEEALRLENAYLYKIVNRFAKIRAGETHPKLEKAVRLTREELSVLKSRQKAALPRELDALEKAVQNLLSVLGRIPIVAPVLVMVRWGSNAWEAHIEDHEEDLGVGEGASPTKAVYSLHNTAVVFQMTYYPQTAEARKKDNT